MSELALIFLKNSIPYLVAGIAGFGLAFGIQQLRIENVEQAFEGYKLEQQSIIQYQIDQANKQRKVAADAYQQKSEVLQKDIDEGNAYRRCVAAGKCGVRRSTSCTQPSVQAVGEDNGGRGITVPTASVPAEESSCEELANGAAKVQLQLNQLQDEVAGQDGYEK